LRLNSGGLSAPALPTTPRPLSPSSPSLIPPRGSNLHANGPASTGDASNRRAFEKTSLRKVSPVRDTEAGQSLPQSPFSTGNPSFQAHGAAQQGWPRQSAQQVAGDLQQSAPRSYSQPLTQRRPTSFDDGATVRNTPRVPQTAAPLQQPSQPNAAVRPAGQSSSMRPLLPGLQLRGNRYRLQELLERQDWLSGVFEAVWIGKDAQRGGASVMITEVALPETSSVMSQSILRTATMALANVGRHPRIPALWDAFGDQGRSFFVFEPIDGESLLQRFRFSGRPLPEQDVIECCLQMTEVLDLLSQQSPQVVHGLIRPEHIIGGRSGSQYFLTNFSVLLAGGATQFVVGMERNRLSPYTPPEFVRGLVDVRTDMYSLIAAAYQAITGVVPASNNGSIPQAQRINRAISPEFDAILNRGLRAVANQRYQRPAELRQDLLALRSVNGSLVSSNNSNAAGAAIYSENYASTQAARNWQQSDSPQRAQEKIAPSLPIRLATDAQDNEQMLLLPKPEELPPLEERDDKMNAALWLSLIMVAIIVLVILSQVVA